MRKFLARGIPALCLSVALSLPLQAMPQAPQKIRPETQIPGSSLSFGQAITIAVAAIAGIVVVAIVVIHNSKSKRAITGCVNSSDGALTLRSERDGRIYVLAGDTASVKPGDRMKLRGKKIKAGGGAGPGWEITRVDKDFGVCHP